MSKTDLPTTFQEDIYYSVKSIVLNLVQCHMEKSQINKLTYHLKESEKEEQTKPKVSTREELIKIREQINKIKTKKKKK